jgi:hypothetical protein
MIKKLFLFPLFTLLCLGTTTGVTLADVSFPSQIMYRVVVAGKNIGSAQLRFNRRSKYAGIYAVNLSNFEGLGIKSDEQMFTYVDQADLSLSSAFVSKGKKRIYEIKTVEREDLDLTKRRAYAYKEAGAKGSIDTMIYSDHKVIDLLSSFLVFSEKVRNHNLKSEKFNLWLDKSTKIVDLVHKGNESVVYKGAKVKTTVLSLKYDAVELFKFNIYGEKGYYFPVKVSIESDDKGLVEFVADTIIP